MNKQSDLVEVVINKASKMLSGDLVIKVLDLSNGIITLFFDEYNEIPSVEWRSTFSGRIIFLDKLESHSSIFGFVVLHNQEVWNIAMKGFRQLIKIFSPGDLN